MNSIFPTGLRPSHDNLCGFCLSSPDGKTVRNGCSGTKFCDIRNASPETASFVSAERNLAMVVGDKFIAEKIMPYDLAEFCDASNLPLRQVATSLNNLCAATMGRVESLPLGDVLTGEEMDFAQDLIEKVKGNAERLLTIAESFRMSGFNLIQ